MRNIWRWITSSDVGDQDLNRRVQATKFTAVFAILALPLVIILEVLAGSSPFEDPLSFFTLPATFLIPLGALILIRLRRPRAGIYWLLIALSSVMAAGAITYGLSASNFTILAGVIILAALLAGTKGIILGVVTGLVATLGAYLVSRAQPGINLYRLQNETLMELAIFPLLGLLTGLFQRSLTGLTHRARQQAQDISDLNVTLEQRVTELAASSQQLQQAITQSQRRAQRLATAAEASRVLSATLVEPADLLNRAANLVREQFDLYYVGIFLLDETRRHAELRAGTGAAGQQMVAQGYELEVGGASAVGRCLTDRQGRIAPDMSPEARRFETPLLPETRSELALPLISRGEMLGAVTVHSTQAAVFDEEDVTIFQSVADQIANAIVSTRLLVQTQTALAEATRAHQRYQREAWAKFLPARQIVGYQYHDQATQALSHRLLPEVRQTVNAAQTLTAAAEDGATLFTPLTLRGQVIGALGLQDGQRQGWTSAEIAMVEAIADQVALAVENARLFEEAQASLTEVTATYQRYVREAWSEYLPVQSATWFEHAVEALSPMEPEVLPTIELVTAQGQRAVTSSTEAATLAIPLALRGQVLGVLGFQDDPDRQWSEDEIAVVEAVAEQMALAVENARLFDESQARLAEVETTHRRYLRRAWAEYLAARPVSDFQFTAAGVTPLDDVRVPEMEQALAHRRVTIASTTKDCSTLSTPIVLRGEVFGALGLQDEGSTRHWTSENVELVEAVAIELAQAIEAARLFEETQRRVEETRLLLRVSETAASTLDIVEVMRHVAQEVAQALGADMTGAYLVDEAGQELMPIAGYHVPPEQLEAYSRSRIPLEGHAFVEEAWKSRQPVYSSNVPQDPRFDTTILEVFPAQSVLVTPMIARDKVIGALWAVWWEEARHFTAEERQLVEGIIRQAGIAVENARLFQEIEGRARELGLLFEAARDTSASLKAEEVTQRLIEHVCRAADVTSVDLLLVDESGTQATVVGQYASPQATKAESIPDVGSVYDLTSHSQILEAMRRQQSSVTHVDDPDLAPATREMMAKFGGQSALRVPLVVGGTLRGYVLAWDTRRRHEWDDDTVRLCQTLAGQAAIALENARAYQELQDTAEQLQEMDRLKTQFLANMSHELRTPLNAIIGFSRVILKGIDGPLTENQKVDLTAIYENGQQLLALINNVLDLSKIQAGKMEIFVAPVDLKPVLHSVLSTATALVADKPIELCQEVQPDLPLVQGDEMLLRQVILNLVSNAANFTQVGSITLRAWADAEQVTVSVTDTGVGIAPEHQAFIFEEFRQVDGSLTRRAGGTGLGLAISRHLVEEHGGHIWVESTPGEGSTFSFTVPLHSPQRIQLPEELADQEFDLTRPIILAVDGQEGVIALYRRYLEKHGYQVIGLQEGAKALAWARALQPLAIIQDLSLPDKDGWAVLEELKSAAETRNIPVAISTMDRDSRNRALRRGAATYLIKPVLEKDLLDALKPFAVE